MINSGDAGSGPDRGGGGGMHMKEKGFLVERIKIEPPRRIRLRRRTSSTHSNKANYPGNEAEN